MSADSPSVTADGLRHVGNFKYILYLRLSSFAKGALTDDFLDRLDGSWLQELRLGNASTALENFITPDAVTRSVREGRAVYTHMVQTAVLALMKTY